MTIGKQFATAAALVAVGVVIGVYISNNQDAVPEITRSAAAAGGKVESPTGVAPDRYVYYPGTEELDREEIRIVCCGSGMVKEFSEKNGLP